MRQTILFSVAVLTAVSTLSATGWNVKKYAPSVHAILAGDNFCSAVKVGENGILLTVAHCVIGDKPIVHLATGREATMVYRSAEDDLVVLQLPVGGLTLKVAKKDPNPGDETLSLGFGNMSFTPIPGHWIGFTGPPETEPTILSVGAIQGMSGGPVLNRKGEIVGLVRGVFETPSAHITSLVLRKLLEDAVKKWVR